MIDNYTSASITSLLHHLDDSPHGLLMVLEQLLRDDIENATTLHHVLAHVSNQMPPQHKKGHHLECEEDEEGNFSSLVIVI